MNGTVPFQRKLTKDDLLRMRIPRRYWEVRFDEISDTPASKGVESPREIIRSYLERMAQMLRTGSGLILWGPNGTGKTSAAVVIAKAFRKHGHRVLYLEGAELKRLVFDRVAFDDEESYWERAMRVDLLIVDDFGKGTQDEKGAGARLIDELIRHRNAHRLVTILTTNMAPGGEDMKAATMPSTREAMIEHVMPIKVVGDNKRMDSSRELAAHVLGE